MGFNDMLSSLQQHYQSLIDTYYYFHSKCQTYEMNPNSMIQPQDEDEDVPYDFQDGTSKLSLYLSGSLS